ncbi:Cyclin-A1-3 [Morella rubra]|uniref:B-like cyclin n=1 Tax=Morella rubra TaxID=262757 RepID=A0A6A1W9N1_9ROSI|nr:Cyclin-A1-3 [Morella rubra]
MSTSDRFPPPFSSSSSAMKPSDSHNPTRKVKKKRPALADVTNQRNESKSNSRTSLSSSKTLVPCAANIAKTKKQVSACPLDIGFSQRTLPPSLSLKSSVLVLPKDTSFPGCDQPMSSIAALSSPCSVDAVLPAPSSPINAPRGMDVSPSISLGGSVSLDESMSTCESLRSPELEYIDNEDSSPVTSIEPETSNGLNISDTAEKAVFHMSNSESVRKRCIFVEMETFDKVVDIDRNLMDPQCCGTIAYDIYKNLRVSEANKSPSTDFMEMIQKEINASMRAVLIDWLVEVAEEYRLLPDTLFLAVNYIDRYLSGNSVKRQRLQLLGVACMMIAAKYEEICAPNVDEFCYITDHTYEKQEVFQMESAVLNYLKFEMTAPTAKCFLRRFVCAAQATSEVPSMQLECLANYLVELSLPEYNMLRYAPSLVAASATFLAKFILLPKRKPWNLTLKHYTLYQASDLSDCVKALHSLCCNCGSSNLPAVREKYSQHKVFSSFLLSLDDECKMRSISNKFFLSQFSAASYEHC